MLYPYSLFCALLLYSAALFAHEEELIDEELGSKYTVYHDAPEPSGTEETAQETPLISLASLEGEPNAFVFNCVNVISGQYCDSQTDLISYGSDPILVERSFCGAVKVDGNLCKGWSLNHKGHLSKESGKFKEDKKHLYGEKISVQLETGSSLSFASLYEKKKEAEKNKLSSIKLYKESLYGVCNTSHGYISGQTNIKNFCLYRNKKEDEYLLKAGSGSERTFSARAGKFVLHAEKKPNGNILEYPFMSSKNESQNGFFLDLKNAQNKRLHSIFVKTDPKHNKIKKIYTEDGRHVTYTLLKPEADAPLLLTKVEKSDGIDENYKYSKVTSQVETVEKESIRKTTIWITSVSRYWMTERQRPEGRYLLIDYYDYHTRDPNDPLVNRVKRIKAPAGSDATPVKLYFFEYEIERRKKREKEEKKFHANDIKDYTYVYDANGHKTSYGYNLDHQLNLIIKYDEKGQPCSEEHFFWGERGTNQWTQLSTKTVSSYNKLQSAVHYMYDERGNVLEKKLYGNLSGNNLTLPTINHHGLVLENGSECYCVRSVYSDDGFNLLLEETDGVQTTAYTYYPGTNLLKSKLQGHPERWLRRWFYGYNQDAALVWEIVDDGSGKEQSDLTGVTERLITTYVPRKTYPVGLPERVEEKYLDLTTGKQKPIHKKIMHYTQQGWLAAEEHYDQEGSLRYTLTWEYDSKGNLIRERDAGGREVTRAYDLNNNCTLEQDGLIARKFTYDFMDRLIKEETVHTDGTSDVVQHRYDFMSRRSATVDTYGNETQFSYDPFGRVTKITYPEVLDEKGLRYHPEVRKAYDLNGKVISEIDARGFAKKASYNIRGQPIAIEYADGTSETHLYTLNGVLKESRAVDGTTIRYTSDALGRNIMTQTFSAEGALLSTSSAEYSGSHLLSETDPMGVVTHYTYYPHGKLKSKLTGDHLTLYEYDALLRQVKTIEQYGERPADSISKVQEYDVLNRVICDKVEDAQGQVLTRVDYVYDQYDNVIETISFQKSGVGLTTTTYDSRGTPIVVKDAAGGITTTCYKDDYYNELGQRVEYQEVTDPLGNRAISIKDALGREVCRKKMNAVGQEIQRKDFLYDGNGNLCKIAELIQAQGKISQFQTLMTYDSENRLIEQREGYGSSWKIMKQSYNAYGQKELVVKADGGKLFYRYDPLGRLLEMESSDGSIHYRYTYDANHNPLRVDNLVSKQATIREFDANNRMLSETLANGLKMHYAYDRVGRLMRITFPDNSGTSYEYRACFMEAVHRLDKSGQIGYTHRYGEYDQAGHLLAAQMIGKAGQINYEYDSAGRLAAVSSDQWKEQKLVYDKMGNLTAKEVLQEQAVLPYSYEYDDLYQLKSETGSCSHTYAYDSHYNRVQKDNQHYELNRQQQIVKSEHASYLYDNNGNLTQQDAAGQVTKYTYDALDRLVQLEEGQRKYCYSYDENNRRLSKTTYEKLNNGRQKKLAHERYLYSGRNEIGAVDDKGAIVELRILGYSKGAEIGSAIAVELEGKAYAPIHDVSGNLTGLIEAQTGQVKATYKYSAFGAEEQLEGVITPWRFSSKRVDAESGLVYFGMRYYNPSLGRWITPDPIGSEGGPNLYAYILNRPLTYFDAYGLFPDFGAMFSNFANGMFRNLRSCGEMIGRGINHFANVWRRECPIPILRDTFASVCHFFKASSLNGYKMEYSGPHSKGSMHYGLDYADGKVAIVTAPGMCNNAASSEAFAELVSRTHGGSRVFGYNNQEHGFLSDLLESALMKLGFSFNSMRKFAETTRDALRHVGPEGEIYMYAHSQGGLLVDSLQNYLTPDELKQINVVTLGSAKMISDKAFRSAVNYVCPLDPVPLLSDAVGLVRSRFDSSINVRFVPPRGNLFKIHSIAGEAYGPILGMEGFTFRKSVI